MQYYDVETKTWKSLAASTTPQLKIEGKKFLSADLVGNKLFVVIDCHIYSYDTEKKLWEKIPHPSGMGSISELRTIGDYMYAMSTTLSSYSSQVPQRYNFVKRRWQRYAVVTIPRSENESCSVFFNSGTTVLHSKVYVLYGSKSKSEGTSWGMKPAVLYYFDPVENKWERKASTRRPHFGSTLFLVNGRLHVAGGNVKITDSNNSPYGDPAHVEVYDEQNNSWSVVKQDHIPPNKLGAVEIEGRVYFIINRFPIDSGIRIPPGEKYHVDLDDWENLGKVNSSSVLCYLPANRENVITE